MTKKKNTKEPAIEITGTIKEAVLVWGIILGRIYGDTKGRFSDGESIKTSPIIEHVKPDIYLTENSAYRVEFYIP